MCEGERERWTDGIRVSGWSGTNWSFGDDISKERTRRKLEGVTGIEGLNGAETRDQFFLS